jgi:hypothetical protein
MIDLNKQTRISRMASIMLFVGIVPALSFYIGLEYMLTRHMVEAAEVNVEPVVHPVVKCPEESQ